MRNYSFNLEFELLNILEGRKNRNMSFIEVKDLKVHYPIRGGFFNKVIDHVYAVDGVSLTIEEGKTGSRGLESLRLGKR